MHIYKKLHDVITIIFTPNFEQFFISFNSTQHFVLSLRKGDIILMSCKSINKNKSWRPIRQLEIVLRFLSPRKLNKWYCVEKLLLEQRVSELILNIIFKFSQRYISIIILIHKKKFSNVNFIQFISFQWLFQVSKIDSWNFDHCWYNKSEIFLFLSSFYKSLALYFQVISPEIWT